MGLCYCCATFQQTNTQETWKPHGKNMEKPRNGICKWWIFDIYVKLREGLPCYTQVTSTTWQLFILGIVWIQESLGWNPMPIPAFSVFWKGPPNGVVLEKWGNGGLLIYVDLSGLPWVTTFSQFEWLRVAQIELVCKALQSLVVSTLQSQSRSVI